MRIYITVNCPNCNNIIRIPIQVIPDENMPTPELHLMTFEHTEWECPNPDCEKTWAIGDIDLVDVEDL